MTPDAFRAALPARGVLAGVDFGMKRIGLAFSDPEWRIAGPDRVIRRTRLANDFKEIGARLGEREARGVVIGLPLNMDGTAGPSAQRARAFARALEAEFRLPLLMWDERLSSFAVEDAMTEAGVPRARRAEKVDALAAAHILQSALDALRAEKA